MYDYSEVMCIFFRSLPTYGANGFYAFTMLFRSSYANFIFPQLWRGTLSAKIINMEINIEHTILLSSQTSHTTPTKCMYLCNI